MNTLKIAVYTENIGGYEEVRIEGIPSVPSGMDAFYFADPATLDKHEGAFALWRKNGWTTIEYTDMQQGTEQVSGQRLTAKKVKLDPPDWITEGKWHFDAQKWIRLEKLPCFIQKRSNASLIVHNWCRPSRMCCSQGGFGCFQAEARKLRGHERQRIENSSQEYFQWVSDVTEMVKNSTLSLPHYFETNIFHAKLEEQIQW